MKFLLLTLIRAYQWVISPLLGTHCRFAPSCSCYAQDALKMHGALRGSLLTLKRVLRCQPFGGSGFDPVPRPEFSGQSPVTNTELRTLTTNH
jgi:putative membrane protein insertion efficiency factor